MDKAKRQGRRGKARPSGGGQGKTGRANLKKQGKLVTLAVVLTLAVGPASYLLFSQGALDREAMAPADPLHRPSRRDQSLCLRRPFILYCLPLHAQADEGRHRQGRRGLYRHDLPDLSRDRARDPPSAGLHRRTAPDSQARLGAPDRPRFDQYRELLLVSALVQPLPLRKAPWGEHKLAAEGDPPGYGRRRLFSGALHLPLQRRDLCGHARVFVVPLIAVLLGLSNRRAVGRLARWEASRKREVKLAMGLVMILLGASILIWLV